MYEELLAQNQGLLYTVARKFARGCYYDRAVSIEDLVQAGFFGLIKAEASYSPDKGAWYYWAARYAAREMKKALGYSNGRFTKAHSGAVSLDAPLCDLETDLTHMDLLPDDSLPDVDDHLNHAAVQKAVRDAVDRLPNQQREVITQCDLEELPYKVPADQMGITVERVRQIRSKALAQLRRDKALLEEAEIDIELRTPYYAKVTVTQFRNTRTSATEKAALWKIDHEKRRQQQLERLKEIERRLTETEEDYNAYSRNAVEVQGGTAGATPAG